MSKRRRSRPHPQGQQMFEAAANSPHYWESVAYELVAAGNVCFRRYARFNSEIRPPAISGYYEDVSPRSFWMLYAFALEAMLKGAWLAQGNIAVAPGANALDAAFTRIGGHNLHNWWRAPGLNAPNARESLVLDFLTSYIEIGRYPVRARASQRPDDRLLGGLESQPVILAMLEQAQRRLRDALPRGPGVLPPRLGTLGVRRTHRRRTLDGIHQLRRA